MHRDLLSRISMWGIINSLLNMYILLISDIVELDVNYSTGNVT